MAVFAALPDPDTIRRTAADVVQRSEFRLDPESNADEVLLRLLLRGMELLGWIFRWLFQLVEGLPEWLQWVIVVGLVLIVVLISAHLIYTICSLFWGVQRPRGEVLTMPRVVVDPANLERQSAEAAARGDCSLAVRLLFRAGLLRLEKAEDRKLRGGTTNREVLQRHRHAPVYEPMKVFVEIIETKWYGMGDCSLADYETCRVAHAELLRSMKGASDVHDT